MPDGRRRLVHAFFTRYYLPLALAAVAIHTLWVPLPWLFHSGSEQNAFGMLLALCLLMDGALAALDEDITEGRRPGARESVKRVLDYGGVALQGRSAVRLALIGLMAGVLIWATHVTTISFIYGRYPDVTLSLPLIIILYRPATALAMYLVVPVFEELLYRGVLVKRLLYALGDTTRTRVLSGCVSAVLFALTHPRYPSHKLIPGVAFVALVFASPGKERTIVPAIAAHITVNVLFSIATV